MTVRVQLVGLVDGSSSEHDGRYLIDCDVDAGDGMAWPPAIRSTDDPKKAKKFSTTVEAWEYWARPSTVRPRRPDKKPNRPLTAYTIQLTQE
jgi:hypothetical protein